MAMASIAKCNSHSQRVLALTHIAGSNASQLDGVYHPGTQLNTQIASQESVVSNNQKVTYHIVSHTNVYDYHYCHHNCLTLT